MFKKLMNFSYRRNWKEAIGFYLVFLLLMMFAGMMFAEGMVGGLASLVINLDELDEIEVFNFGLRIGNIFGVIGVLLIGSFLLKEKKLWGHIGYILLVLLSGIITFGIGSILGLIPLAYLTTRENSFDENKNI